MRRWQKLNIKANIWFKHLWFKHLIIIKYMLQTTYDIQINIRTGTKAGLIYCPLDSLGKTFSALCLILNENIFWLTASYKKPFVFSVSVLFSQIRTLKLNVRPKIGLFYTISKVVTFLNMVWETIFYFYLPNLNYWYFTTILWKFQKLKKRNLLEICIQVT